MVRWINDNEEYYNGRSIVYDGQLIINPTDEQLTLAGYHQVIPPEPTVEELLDNAKADKLMAIDGYDSSDAVNVFFLGGNPMWLDAPTRQTLRTSIDAYVSINAEQVTKWFGGQQFTFPTQVWLAMLNALEVYAGEALNVTEAHKAAVMALDNVDDVENYDYTTGYPVVLNFNEQWMRSLSLQ